jgi:hypothetical protein
MALRRQKYDLSYRATRVGPDAVPVISPRWDPTRGTTLLQGLIFLTQRSRYDWGKAAMEVIAVAGVLLLVGFILATFERMLTQRRKEERLITFQRGDSTGPSGGEGTPGRRTP